MNGVLNAPEKIGTVKVSRGWFMPSEDRDLVITGVTLATLLRMSAVVNKMPTKTDKEGVDRIFHFIEANASQIIEVIALAIHNKKGDPPGWLYDSLANQFSIDQLKTIFNRIYGRLDVQSFFGIMGLVREINVLNDTPETEAPGQQSAGLSNTSGSGGKKSSTK